MSHLKIYRPKNSNRVFRFDEPEPDVLPFKPHFQRRLKTDSRRPMNLLDRAKVMYENRQCPECNHPEVEPLELADAVYNGSGQPIPGTATLVGFHCLNCHTEWPLG